MSYKKNLEKVARNYPELTLAQIYVINKIAEDEANEKDVKEAYNYGSLGEWNAKTELEFLVHHLKKEHQELETMEYTVVPC